MKAKLASLLTGVGFGFVIAWTRVSDPAVIRDMLLLREAHVFLLMGSAVLVAAVGVRVLRVTGVRSLATREPIAWSVEQPRARHVLGSAIFGAGWSIAGTCPAPVAVMVGQGRLGGLWVVIGLIVGVVLQGVVHRWRAARVVPVEVPGTAGV